MKTYLVKTNYSEATIIARDENEARSMFRKQFLQGYDYLDDEIVVE